MIAFELLLLCVLHCEVVGGERVTPVEHWMLRKRILRALRESLLMARSNGF